MEESERSFLLAKFDLKENDKKQRLGRSLTLCIAFAAGIVIFVTLQHAQPPVYVLQKSRVTLRSLEVEVSEGRLLGKVMKARNDRKFLAFLGVPYAKPPIGDLRFMPPVEPERWRGVRDATEYLPYCPKPKQGKSTDSASIVGEEDCLHLNIFTTHLDSHKPLFPVMLYIHGGANGYGYGQRYSPDYFMEEDVVVITMDYRAGPLGTLNLNIPEASGNQGLKDQVQALKWIRKNIQNFGGNPEKVTIFGNSGGAFQVSLHVLSPLSRGLFHRAIFQSGTALIPGVFSANPERDALELAELSNCSAISAAGVLKCLKNLPFEDIIANAAAIKRQFTFTFSMDSASLPNDTFLPQFPLEILINGTLANVTLITGVTSAEGLLYSTRIFNFPDHPIVKAGSDLEALVHYFSKNYRKLDLSASDPLAIAEKVVNFYMPYGIDPNSSEVFWNVTNMFSDRDYDHPMWVAIQRQLEQNLKNAGKNEIGQNMKPLDVYAYYFNQKVEYSHAGAGKELLDYDGLDTAPAHADELQFLFPLDYTFPPITADHKDVNFSRQLVKFWTNFANTGEPGVAPNGNRWLPVTQGNPVEAFQLNDEDFSMIPFLPERIQFWNQFSLSDLYR